MNYHLTADDEKGIAMHNDRRALVNSDPQQFWVCRYDGTEVSSATTGVNVLVDSRIGQQAETCFMSGRDHNRVVAVRVSSIPRCATN